MAAGNYFQSLGYTDGLDQTLFCSSSHMLNMTATEHEDVVLLDLKTSKPSPNITESSNQETITENASTITIEDRSTFICEWSTCGCVFILLDDLVNHVKVEHIVLEEDSMFRCYWKNCSRRGRGFNAKYKILVHVRTHTKERPHACPMCHKQFTRVEILKIHMRSHTGEKPYHCTEPGCDRAYTNTSDRFKHVRTHHTQKPFQCKTPNCDKRYTDPSSLRKHARTLNHHSSQRSVEDQPIEGYTINENINEHVTNCSIVVPSCSQHAHQTLTSNPLLSSAMLSNVSFNYDMSSQCGLNLSFSALSSATIVEDASLDVDDSCEKSHIIQETPLDLSTSPITTVQHEPVPAKWEFIIVDSQSS